MKSRRRDHQQARPEIREPICWPMAIWAFVRFACRLKRTVCPIDNNNLAKRQKKTETKNPAKRCNKSALSVKMSILIVDWLPPVAAAAAAAPATDPPHPPPPAEARHTLAFK